MLVSDATTSLQNGLNTGAAAGGEASIDFQNFLKLLTAQLRNQDPTAPLDATQFVSQLASFSTVEQLVSANKRLDNLAAALAGGDLEKYSSWIGLKAQIEDGVSNYSGTPVEVSVVADPSAASAEFVIADASGTVLDRRPIANADASFVWDGSLRGGAAQHGIYLLSVDYFDANGAPLANRPSIVSSTITDVRLTAQGVELGLADGRRTPVSGVIGVKS